MVVLPVPPELCAECGLCCRFSDPEVLTPWATRNLPAGTLPLLFQGSGPIHLAEGRGRMDLPAHVCSALDGGSYRCTLWDAHPADCRIYPLVLVRRNGGFSLALDPDCPFSSRVSREFFREWALRFREEEWSLLTGLEISRIAELAAREDRPSYEEILALSPFPEPSGNDSG